MLRKHTQACRVLADKEFGPVKAALMFVYVRISLALVKAPIEDCSKRLADGLLAAQSEMFQIAFFDKPFTEETDISDAEVERVSEWLEKIAQAFEADLTEIKKEAMAMNELNTKLKGLLDKLMK